MDQYPLQDEDTALWDEIVQTAGALALDDMRRQIKDLQDWFGREPWTDEAAVSTINQVLTLFDHVPNFNSIIVDALGLEPLGFGDPDSDEEDSGATNV